MTILQCYPLLSRHPNFAQHTNHNKFKVPRLVVELKGSAFIIQPAVTRAPQFNA